MKFKEWVLGTFKIYQLNRVKLYTKDELWLITEWYEGDDMEIYDQYADGIEEILHQIASLTHQTIEEMIDGIAVEAPPCGYGPEALTFFGTIKCLKSMKLYQAIRICAFQIIKENNYTEDDFKESFEIDNMEDGK